MGFNEETSYTTTNILVSSHGSDVRRAITIASGIGALPKGEVLGQYASGVNSGTYGSYDNEATDGRGVARGILTDSIDATASGVLATMYTHGIFYEEMCTNLDATAKSDLNNCEFINVNV